MAQAALSHGWRRACCEKGMCYAKRLEGGAAHMPVLNEVPVVTMLNKVEVSLFTYESQNLALAPLTELRDKCDNNCKHVVLEQVSTWSLVPPLATLRIW